MSVKSSKRTATRLKPSLPPDEARRLATLYLLEILDSPAQEQFDRITRMAQRLFAVPIAVISFVDADRDWFKSRLGVEATELPRELSFSSHTILERDVLVVQDAAMDLRFFNNPLVEGASGIRFYAGCPITAWNGVNIGALSIMSPTPRTLTTDERNALRDLAAAVEHEIGASALKLVDELTGLMNHRGLRLIANHIVPRASRDGEAMSMLFIDFQDLDSVNKNFGRPAGDAALVVVADVLRETLRSADIPARMRGDDFAILLPDTEDNEVAAVISRIRHELDQRSEQQQLPGGLTVRISCATLDPSAEDFSLEGLIALADAAS